MIRSALLLPFVLSTVTHASRLGKPGACSAAVVRPPIRETLKIDPRFTLEYSGSGRFVCEECHHEAWRSDFGVHLHALRFASLVLTDVPELAADAKLRPAQRVILQAFEKVASGARVFVISKSPSIVGRAISSLSVTTEPLDLEAHGLLGETLSYIRRNRR